MGAVAPLLNLTNSGSDTINKVAVAHLWAYHIFVTENRDASEQRVISDKCGSYLTWLPIFSE